MCRSGADSVNIVQSPVMSVIRCSRCSAHMLQLSPCVLYSDLFNYMPLNVVRLSVFSVIFVLCFSVPVNSQQRLRP